MLIPFQSKLWPLTETKANKSVIFFSNLSQIKLQNSTAFTKKNKAHHWMSLRTCQDATQQAENTVVSDHQADLLFSKTEQKAKGYNSSEAS